MKTSSWKCLFTSSYIWLARRRRESNIVSRNPSISNEGFSFVLIILIVFKSLLIPSSAKYSHCTGIITESAAVKALMVTKRDGKLEPINLDKIHRVITWAAEGLENVSVSQVELRSHIQFYEGIRTSDIHETIIKAAADLISKDTPDYQYLAARLAVFHLRKKAYGHFDPPRLYDHVKKLAPNCIAHDRIG